MESGSGFCQEQRSRSPFVRDFDAEWHCRQQGYQHLDHSVMHHQMHSRMFMEKIEPSSSSAASEFLRPPQPPHPPCSCYSCAMARHSSSSQRLPPSDPWCYQSKEYLGKPSEASSAGMQSPCFSIRTPLRKESPMLPSDSPCTADRNWMWKYNQQSSGYGAYSADRLRSSQLSQNQLTLHKWFMMKLKDSEVSPVAVGGYVSCGYGMELVKTGPIVDRIDKGRLRTRDGVDVRLMGCIDEEATVAHGFSGFVTQFFFSGFPCTWRKIIDDGATFLTDNVEKASSPVDLKLQSKNVSSEPFQDACPETPVATIPGVKPVSEDEEVLLGCTKEVIHTGEAACMSPPASKENPEESAAEDPQAAPVAKRAHASKENPEESAAEDPQAAPVAKRAQARKRPTNRLPTRCSKRLKDKDSQESDGSNDSRGKRDREQDAGRKGDGDTDREEVVKEVDNVSAPLNTPAPPGDKPPEVGPDPSEDIPAPTENNSDDVAEAPEAERVVEVPAHEDAPVRASAPANRKRSRRGVSRGSRKKKTPARKVAEAPAAKAAASGDSEDTEAEQQVLETAPDSSTDPGIAENQQEGNAQAGETDPAANTDDDVIIIEEAPEPVKETESEQQLSPPRLSEEEIEDSDVKIKKRGNSRRTSRARKPARRKRGCESKPLDFPVVQLDSDEQPEPKLEPKTEPKTESKPVNQRGRRSALPPPLPASRVEKSEVIEAYGLKTSRSGRLLVPPLAYWRNQTLALDKDGGIIAIMDGFAEPPSDTGVFNFKPPSEKKRLQEKLCAAAAADPPASNKRGSNDKGKRKVRGSK